MILCEDPPGILQQTRACYAVQVAAAVVRLCPRPRKTFVYPSSSTAWSLSKLVSAAHSLHRGECAALTISVRLPAVEELGYTQNSDARCARSDRSVTVEVSPGRATCPSRRENFGAVPRIGIGRVRRKRDWNLVLDVLCIPYALRHFSLANTKPTLKS